MHALIIADLEGVVGVYNLSDVDQCKCLFSQEIEVCVKALKKCGIDEITVCDAHNQGNYIDRDMLELYNVKHIQQMRNLSFDKSYDFAFLTGFHGMKGTQGIFSHTFRPEIEKITLNSIKIGEVEVLSRWLGGHQIPVILVTGDTEAVYEANRLNSYRQVCCVKGGHSIQSENIVALYQKIEINIKSALDINFSDCISKDIFPVSIEFTNKDIIKKLSEDMNLNNGTLNFENCTVLMSKIYDLANKLNEIMLETRKINIEFAKKIKNIIGNMPKEAVNDIRILDMLKKSSMELDSDDRNEILLYFKKICCNEAII